MRSRIKVKAICFFRSIYFKILSKRILTKIYEYLRISSTMSTICLMIFLFSDAEMPDDWDEEIDGEWEAPQVIYK